MAELTKERLKALSNRENVGAICSDEISAMARQLLAGLEQEPVAWQWLYRDKRHVTNDPARAKFVAEDGDVNVQPLYAAPQLPQPAVTDELLDEIDNLLTACRVYACRSRRSGSERDIPRTQNAQEKLRACRAAMLQGAEPVQEQHQTAGSACKCRSSEKVQVLQAGWVAVPVEPTPEMNKAGWAAMNEHDAIDPTYRAMLAAAPRQEVRSGC